MQGILNPFDAGSIPVTGTRFKAIKMNFTQWIHRNAARLFDVYVEEMEQERKMRDRCFVYDLELAQKQKQAMIEGKSVPTRLDNDTTNPFACVGTIPDNWQQKIDQAIANAKEEPQMSTTDVLD